MQLVNRRNTSLLAVLVGRLDNIDRCLIVSNLLPIPSTDTVKPPHIPYYSPTYVELGLSQGSTKTLSIHIDFRLEMIPSESHASVLTLEPFKRAFAHIIHAASSDLVARLLIVTHNGMWAPPHNLLVDMITATQSAIRSK